MNKKFVKLEQLRKQLKENKKAIEFYNYLKEYNKGDILYGWIFENDAILTDTIEDLDIYEDSYKNSILDCYIGELETIINNKEVQ